jgi:tight adherence protein B
LLPFGTGALMMLGNPGFLDVLWQDQAGIKMLGTVLVSMVFGAFWMRRIVKIRV